MSYWISLVWLDTVGSRTVTNPHDDAVIEVNIYWIAWEPTSLTWQSSKKAKSSLSLLSAESPNLTPTRMAKINKTNDSSWWRGHRVRRILIHCCWDCKFLHTLLCKEVWEFFRNIEIDLSLCSSIPTTLGHIPKGCFMDHRVTCLPMFIATVFKIVRNWKLPNSSSTDQWIKKIWHSYTVDYYSTIMKKSEITKFACKGVGLEKTHPELGNLDPERQIWYILVYMWVLAVESMINKLQSIDSQRLDIE